MAFSCNPRAREVETEGLLRLAGHPSWSRFSECHCLETPGGKRLRKTPNIYLWSSRVRTHTGTHIHTHENTYTQKERQRQRDRMWTYFVYVCMCLWVCVCSGSCECWNPGCVLFEDHLPCLSLLLFFSFGFSCFVCLFFVCLFLRQGLSWTHDTLIR